MLDKILDFLFRSKLGVFISVLSLICVTLILSGCIVLDTMACMCSSCGAYDCADSCLYCSENMDDTCHTCFGGYEANCKLNDCLFGVGGCSADCGSCYLDCGGLNYSCYDNSQGADTLGCYTGDGGHRRFDCSNCTFYCDGNADPGSPSYSTVFLYSVNLLDTTGEGRSFGIYQGTKQFPLPATPVPDLDFIGYYSAPDGNGTKYSDEEGVIIEMPIADATLYPYYADKYAGIDYHVKVMAIDIEKNIYTEKASFIIHSGETMYDKLPAYTDVPPHTFRGWTSSAFDPAKYMMSDGTNFFEEFAIFDPDKYEILYMNGTLEIHIREVYDGIYLY